MQEIILLELNSSPTMESEEVQEMNKWSYNLHHTHLALVKSKKLSS